MSDGVIQQVSDGKSVYDHPDTAFVASFVGENNPFAGRVARADSEHAVIETAHGLLRGSNPKGLKAGDKALLFVRPESFKLGSGEADATITAETLSSAFEGNAYHVFLKGAGKKDITVTVGRHGGNKIPSHGERAAIHYEPAMGVVLPEGKMARD
jgi:spermidine/putrescine transport system ATP-binding protein